MKGLKRLKKLFTIALALMMLMTMVMAFPVTASAAGDGVITVTAPAGFSIEGQEFTVFKVFDVTYNDGKTSYSYTLNPAFDAFTGYPTYATETLKEYIEGLTGGDIDTKLNDLAGALYTYAGGLGSLTASDKVTKTADSETVTFSGLDFGYYLVYGSAVNADGVTVVAACSLDTTNPEADITLKLDSPTVNKEVLNHNSGTWTDWTDVNIGDTVTFKLTSEVPAMVGYDSYTFIMHDTMSEGLTYIDGSVVVTVGDATLSSPDDFTVTTGDYAGSAEAYSGGHTLTVTFDPDEFAGYEPGDAVTVTYDALLNEKAVAGSPSHYIIGSDLPSPGNPNKVYLEYSNNPYTSGTGVTPEVEVIVYTFDMVIFKYTGSQYGSNTPLAGAVFQLKNGGTNIEFVLISAGDGTAAAEYRVAMDSDDVTTTDISTPGSGKIKLIGLDAGTYSIVETVAPDGYNLMDEPEAVVIIHKQELNGKHIGNYIVAPDGPDPKPSKDNMISIQNNSGTVFPGTGGIGRTIFMVVGLLLMIGALAVVFIRRRVKE